MMTEVYLKGTLEIRPAIVPSERGVEGMELVEQRVRGETGI